MVLKPKSECMFWRKGRPKPKRIREEKTIIRIKQEPTLSVNQLAKSRTNGRKEEFSEPPY